MSKVSDEGMSPDDEEWLATVGEVAREQRRRDEETLAAMAGSPEGRALLAPLGEPERARIVGAAFRGARRPPGALIRSGALGAGGALAAAAAIALAIGTPGRPRPLPAYEVSVSGTPSALRGAPASRGAASVELGAASPFELVFRPGVDVEGPVVAEAFVVDAAGARPWSVPIEISRAGAVRIAGETGSLFGGRRGDFDVLLAAGRPGDLPDAAHAMAWTSATGEGPRVARVHVRITP